MARTLQILCVDDDPLLRRMYAVVLGRLGYTATIVETVREALGYLDTAGHGFDLLLADWNLPEGGEDFAARLSEIDNDLPVVIVTGGLFDRERYVGKWSIREELTKPFNIQELTRAIEGVFDV